LTGEEGQVGPTVAAAKQQAVQNANMPYLNRAMVQATLANANQPVTTTTGRVVSTPASREKERREKIIAKDPSKYSVEDYKQGIQEPGLEDATLDAIDALSMLSGVGYLGKKGAELGLKAIGKGIRKSIYKGVDPMFYNPSEKVKRFIPNLLTSEKDKIKRVEKIMRDSGIRGSYRKAQNRLDAWRVGLDLPQKYNTFEKIGENTFTINPEFFTLNPEIQQSIIAHTKAFNLKDKYLDGIITPEQYEKGLVNINKKFHNRTGDHYFAKYVKEANMPFEPVAIVERRGDKGFSRYDQDRYAGVMGGFRWDVEELPNNKIKLTAKDTWDLYPFDKRGPTRFSDLMSLKRQEQLNKDYIPALKNIEMLKLIGGKPYNIENTFIVDKFKQGGPIYNWIPNYPRVGAKYADGGDTTPIYVTDRNDPRLKAYKDSLNLYNKTRDIENPRYYTDGYPSWYTYRGNREESERFMRRNNIDLDYNYYRTGRFPGNIQPIATGDFGEGMAYPIYKKPVQEVIFSPNIPLMQMRGIPQLELEESVPQKVKVPAHTTIPPQYMDMRGEWSDTPPTAYPYTPEQLLKMGYRKSEPRKKQSGGWLDNL
jgi:hypothetical protein